MDDDKRTELDLRLAGIEQQVRSVHTAVHGVLILSLVNTGFLAYLVFGPKRLLVLGISLLAILPIALYAGRQARRRAEEAEGRR